MINKSAVDSFLSSLSSGTSNTEGASSLSSSAVVTPHARKARNELGFSGAKNKTSGRPTRVRKAKSARLEEKGNTAISRKRAVAKGTCAVHTGHSVQVSGGSGFNLVVVGGTGGLLIVLSFLALVFFKSFLADNF